MGAPTPHHIEKPYYPIVYVRGYAMRTEDRDETFYDTYYGFAATSVEKREAPAPDYFEADVFEGQLIRFMKIKDYGYADQVNRGLETFPSNPSRSLWVARFYDQDVFRNKVRSIEEHAEDVRTLICQTIPDRLKGQNVDLGPNDEDYKVILIAHSMGGLVCRTVIQNLLPNAGEDPKRWIHRLITMGSPHRGIDLGRIPDALERFVTSELNPFDSNIFQEDRMRAYLGLPGGADYEVHSLGDPASQFAFPVKRCLCIIGSDYRDYSSVKELTGTFSDGLVKQDRAYVVTGTKPAGDSEYPELQKCYWANVHRAHSGRRGIVNSFESYENIERFLFGDVRANIYLDEIEIKTPVDGRQFYDFEFRLSIRMTDSYLHRREQDPCENAMRYDRDKVPRQLKLHSAFLNSRRRAQDSEWSHFSARIKVVEHRVKQGWLWDSEYPGRQIYSENVELRLSDVGADGTVTGGYNWDSDEQDWQPLGPSADGRLRFELRGAGAVAGFVVIDVSRWPDVNETLD